MNDFKSEGIEPQEAFDYLVNGDKFTISANDTTAFVNDFKSDGLEPVQANWDWSPHTPEKKKDETSEVKETVYDNIERARVQSVDDVNRLLVGGDFAVPYKIASREQYSPEAQQEANEVVSNAPAVQNEATRKNVEEKRKELRLQNELQKDRYPIEEFSEGDREKFLNWYYGKVQYEATRFNPEDNRDYYDALDLYAGKEFIPEPYQKEYQAYTDLRDKVETYTRLKKDGAGEEAVSKAWDDAMKSRDGLSKARSESFANIDKQISDLKKKRDEVGTGVMSSFMSGVGLQDEADLAIERARIEKQIRALERSKQLVELSPEEAVSELGIEGTGEGLSPEQKLERYHKALLQAYQDHTAEYRDGMLGKVQAGLESTFGFGKSGELSDLANEIKAITPLVMLRRIDPQDDSAWGVGYKTFLDSFSPMLATSLDASTAQDVANRIEGALQLAGAKIDDPRVMNDLNDLASPYEDYRAKDWASMIGPTTAMMLQIAMSGPAYNQITKIGGLNKMIISGKKYGTILGTEKGLTWLGNTKLGRGTMKAIWGGIEEGGRFATAGTIFNQADEELNFASGFFGGIATYPVQRLVEMGAGNKAQQMMARMFGNKSEEAIRKVHDIGEAIRQGERFIARGPGETLEEFGNELGNIYRESDNWEEAKKLFEDRFGNMSDNVKFALSTAIMGYGMGMGSLVGQDNLMRSKKYYNKLSDTEKSQVRAFYSEMLGELDEAANKIGEEIANEQEGSKPKTTETVPEGAGTDGQDTETGTREVSEEQTTTETTETDQGEPGAQEKTESFASKLGETEDLGDIAEGQEKVRIGDTDVILSEDGDTVTLEKIRTDEDKRGKGGAKNALTALTEKADQENKIIELTLKPEKGTDKEALRGLYQQFGFEGDGDQMVRKPNVAETGIDQTQENEITPEVQEQKTGKVESKVQQSKVEKNNAQPIKDATGREVGSKAYMTGEHVVGRSRTIMTPIGRKIKGRYKVVSAGELIQSHNEMTFAKSEGFPLNEDGTTVNDRDYEKDSNAQQEVKRLGNNYNRSAVEKTPVVNAQGLVLDGNNRTMSRKRAAQLGTDQDYVEGLREDAEMYGIDPASIDGVENPMLVFETEESLPMTTETWSMFNKSTKKEKGPIERAVEIGKTVSAKAKRRLGEVYDQVETPSEVTSKPNNVKKIRDILLQSGIVQQNEIARYFDDKNQMTKEGKAFMESIVLGSALSEDTIRSLDVEGMGTIRNRMLQAIVELAKNAARGSDNLIGEIQEGVELIRKAKAAGQAVEDYVSQLDAFEDVQYSPGGLLMGMLMDGKGFKDFLKNYNSEVGTESIFEGTLTKDKLLESGLREKLDQYEQAIKNLRSNEQGSEDQGRQDSGEGDRFQQGERGKPESRSTVEAISEKIRQTFAKVFGTEVEILSDEAIDDVTGEPILGTDGDILGFVTKEGNIVLNGSKLNANTPIHEAGHLWNRWAKENRPDIYQEGLKKVEKSSYYYEVANNPFYQEQAKDMTPDQREEFYKEEALATAIGDSGERFVTDARKKGFKDWLKSLWNSIADFLGIEQMSVEEVRNMTLGEFADRVAASILSGQELEGFVNGTFAEQYMADQESKFSENIAENSQSKALRDMVANNPRLYTTISNKETTEKAIAWINRHGTADAFTKIVTGKAVRGVNDLAHISVAGHILLENMGQQLDEVILEGNSAFADTLLEKIESLTDTMVKNATAFGQALQTHAMYGTKTPMGEVYRIQRTIEKKNADILRKKEAGIENVDDYKEYQELKQEIANLKEDLSDAQRRIVEEVLKNDKFQQQIDGLLKKLAGENKQTVAEDIEEAKGRAKQTKAPTTTKAKKGGKKKVRVSKEQREEAKKLIDDGFKLLLNPKDFSASIIGLSADQIRGLKMIVEGIVKTGYYRVGDIVDTILEKTNKDEPVFDEQDMTDFVVGYINSEPKIREDVEKNYEKEVKRTVSNIKEELDRIIKEHYSKKGPSVKSLAEKISDELGFSGEDAKQIEEAVKRMVEKAAKSYIEQRYKGERRGKNKARDSVFDSFLTSVANGVLDDKALMTNFLKANKLIPNLTTDQKVRIKELVENVQQFDYGTVYYTEAVRDFITYVSELVPKTWLGENIDMFVGLNYASILSGPSTHLVNVGSAQVAMRLEAFQDLFNFHNHLVALLGKGDITQNPDLISALPDLFYRNSAGMMGLINGTQFDAGVRVMKNGSIDNKYIEQVKGGSPFRMFDIERQKHGKNRFKGGKANPWNAAKYISRALEAEDMMMTSSITDRYLAEQYRRILKQDGLKGKNLFDEVMKAMNYSVLNDAQKLQAERQALTEAENFEKSTGRELDKATVRARVRELMRKMVNGELGLTEEQANEMMDQVRNAAEFTIFKGDRNGVISVAAGLIGRVTNSNRALKVLSMPYVPFTKIVGNVAEFMLDAAPGYGLARAYGVSPSAFLHKANVPGFRAGSAKIDNPIARRKQLGRAYLGTVSMVMLWALFAVGDDEDPLERTFYVTGPANFDGKYGQKNPAYQPFTIYIGTGENRKALNYTNIMGLNFALNAIGSYNDAKVNGTFDGQGDFDAFVSYMSLVLMDQKELFMNMSFLSGLNDFIKDLANINESEGKSRFAKVYEEESDMNWASPTGKALTNKFTGFFSNPLIWNFNVFKQSEKMFRQSSYHKRTFQQMLMYHTGLQYIDGGDKRVDIFGEPVFSFPGEQFVAWQHYLTDKENDPRWQFLVDAQFTPELPQNRKISIQFRDEQGNRQKVKRQLTFDEYNYFIIRTGQEFSKRVDALRQMNDSVKKNRSERETVYRDNQMTELQYDVVRAYEDSRNAARQDLRNLIWNDNFYPEYEKIYESIDNGRILDNTKPE